METKTNSGTRLGRLLLEEGLLDESQLQQAIFAQEAQTAYEPLGEICVRLGFVSRRSLRELIAKHQKQIPLGQLLIKMGILTDEQLKKGLDAQRETGKRLGEILVEKAFLTPWTLARSLSIQLGVEKIKPAARLVDRKLLDRVNPAFLRSKRVVPLRLHGEKSILTVVMDNPLDHDTIADLEKIYRAEIEPAIPDSGETEQLLNEIFDSWFLAR